MGANALCHRHAAASRTNPPCAPTPRAVRAQRWCGRSASCSSPTATRPPPSGRSPTGQSVSAETVYKTFSGKQGLIKALWDITLAGDDEPVAIMDREQAREVLATEDLATKMWLYAGGVRAIHERVTPLATLLSQSGPEGAAVLATGEQERRVSVHAFVTHLAEREALRPGIDPAHATDACWALTTTAVFSKLTVEAGWDGATYQRWLTDMLTATLL
ncbi:TetR/AcrR family transcriptional regulator [Streptomyces sp. L7]